MLKVKNLTYRFGKKTALDSVSISFSPGVYGLLGPNGSGKTTLMRCITGLYPIEKGHLFYDDALADEKREFTKHLGYLPQKFGVYYHLTLSQMLLLIANMKGIKEDAASEVSRVLNQVNLQAEADKLIKSLSGGMVRRAGIAQALLGDPDILLFDEPTTGLDPEERLRFQTIIAQIKENKTILISTHIVEDVQSVCEKVVIMNAGKILASGSRQEIAEYASGKIYTLPLSDEKELRQPYIKQKQYEELGVEMLRIASAAPQTVQGVQATVEDGYICYINNI